MTVSPSTVFNNLHDSLTVAALYSGRWMAQHYKTIPSLLKREDVAMRRRTLSKEQGLELAMEGRRRSSSSESGSLPSHSRGDRAASFDVAEKTTPWTLYQDKSGYFYWQ
jgi:hypothetical protein